MNLQLDTTLDTFGLTNAAESFALDTMGALALSILTGTPPYGITRILSYPPEAIDISARVFFLMRSLTDSHDTFKHDPSKAGTLALGGFAASEVYSVASLNALMLPLLVQTYDMMPEATKIARPVVSRADYAEGILAAAGKRIVGIDFTKLNGDARTVNGSISEFAGASVIVREHNLSRKSRHDEYRTAILNRINKIRVNGEVHDLDLIFGSVPA